jgi:hypothetical protein
MYTRRHWSDWSWSAAVWLLVSVILIVAALARASLAGTGEAAPPQQDTIRLESRLNLLEQRFYSIETSIRSLEQQARIGGVASRTVGQEEFRLLRLENEALRQRLADVECGLARLDERTLNPAAREARRKSSGSVVDPCRLNADAPLRLPDRR